MSVLLEWKKLKRTGCFPAFLGGGILAGAVPVLHMAVHGERYAHSPGNPVEILLQANWQVMAMLNVLLVVAGACLFYHTEYADGCLQKMRSLPVRESSIFFGKVMLMSFLMLWVLILEGGAMAFCSLHWFETGEGFAGGLCKSLGYAFLLLQPCIVLSLLIAQACGNMWTSLGIGVVCVFTATMLPEDDFVCSLFPFAAPFQIFPQADVERGMAYLVAVAVELLVLGLAELLWIRGRRRFA